MSSTISVALAKRREAFNLYLQRLCVPSEIACNFKPSKCFRIKIYFVAMFYSCEEGLSGGALLFTAAIDCGNPNTSRKSHFQSSFDWVHSRKWGREKHIVTT